MFNEYPDIISIEQLIKMLGIGKSSAYKLLHENQIRHAKIGRKYLIPKQSVIGFIDSMCYNDDQIIDGRRSEMKGELTQ
jgi:excisionase family DNA binding protein